MLRPKSKNTNSLIERLRQSIARSILKTPEGEGWMTFIEIRKELGVGKGVAYRAIREGLDDGSIETFSGMRTSAPGHQPRPCVWYRFKK